MTATSPENSASAAEADDDLPAPKRRAGGRNPERTRALILEAARHEIAQKGLAGARIDEIAARARTNKRMLYHYFGDKDAIYLAVLEDTYRRIRTAEKSLELAHREPEDALRELALFTWNYYLENPEFLSILANENLLRAEYLKRSPTITDIHSRFSEELADVLRRGAAKGVFAQGLDPVMVYITMASLGFFYLANRHTLGTIFGRNLMDDERIAEWGQHIADTVLASIRARPS